MNTPTLPDRTWAETAIRRIEAEGARSADTHLFQVPVPAGWSVQIYLKDESTHRTGSLKHRLARSLFLFGLVNGWITEGTTIVEASSGSTAVSEAYFAQLLGLPFVAVMPQTTSAEKIRLIEHYGGRCHFVEEPSEVYAAAEAVAASTGGHYMDQFTYAERATDWRGNNNIAESIFSQMAQEDHPLPDWIVVGAGTGGTSATIGRYIRYHRYPTRLAVVDPENSAFFPAWQNPGEPAAGRPSRIEGIGRPRPEPSFVPAVIDHMIQVPDAASVAAARHLRRLTGLHAGPSTGTNLWGVWQLAAAMEADGRAGSIVSLVCDSGDRYTASYGDDAWLASRGLDPARATAVLEELFRTGRWPAG
ncbi:PLP-dependent cysteine synthase family protein [Arthrobacter sp. zg-Y1171]|uniref:PLP-dependent cysteine synthase family protein n=1 Tax=unclassified Arthrobacter TaxID=235627 RepID=UPI002107B7D5|nr:PLP-dependent cysteine synthase family protein [Arthrobacter sp. zg-Y1171]MCQ1947413.1 PLP-dependent cysteine synthase family protein [Arthrobacter sp. zg-Y1116]MCQ1996709.1 PLP-dependent cysteine synthase family protein [Arthrobacter sp. zg-Y1171]UWX82307.1 PLP-dependent cysteine synthase family protein [Arthrobacter sp. zg-Y1171]